MNQINILGAIRRDACSRTPTPAQPSAQTPAEANASRRMGLAELMVTA